MSGYYLKRGDTVFGTLLPYDFDSPWELCHFQPTAAYASVRPRFEHVRQLYEALDQAPIEDYRVLKQQCDAALQAITDSGFFLVDQQTGETISDFLLYIRDRTAELKINRKRS